MRKRFAVAIALCAGLALFAIPSTAGAATIVAGPLKVRGYQMSIVASDAGKKPNLQVMFARSKKKSSQSHLYSFDKRVRVNGNSIRASLGRFGVINLRFQSLRTLKRKGKLPTGCKGRLGRTKVGVMRGKLRFVADRKFFRTIKAKSLRGSVTTSSKLDCSGGGGGNGGDGSGDGVPGRGTTMLTMSDMKNDELLSLTATKRTISVFKQESTKRTAPARIFHSISAVGAGALVSTPAATATVKGLAPFLAGRGQFTPTQNLGIMATGDLGGNLVAKFDSIGRVRLTGPANLMYP